MKSTNKNRKKTILEVYGSIGASCCHTEPSCCGSTGAVGTSERLGYSPDVIGKIPEGTDLGLGCGNPLALAQVQSGETVLDLGSGAGFDCFIAAREVGNEGKVIGIDMTPEMIDTARANALKAGIDNVEFHLGEIENLPLKDTSVDVVISNCVVNLSLDKQTVYNEAFRVLKPGGRLAISDILTRIPLPEKIKQDEKLVAGCVGGAISADELYPIIERAGFINISIVPKSNSDAIISGWKPGDNIEQYIFSAYITANKPAVE